MKTRKKILLLTSGVSTSTPIREAFEEKEVEIRYAQLEDLYIQYSSDTNAGIVLDVSLPVSWTLENFDLVVFRNLGDCREIAFAVATILRKSKIKYIDCGIRSSPSGKISSGIAMWEAGLPVPTTQVVPKDYIKRFMRLQGSFPFIIKPSNSSRGRGNYLIKTPTENIPFGADSHSHYLVQPFIPNDGDYRVYVMGGKVVKNILRQAKEGSHLNNISQGGTATLVDLPNQLHSIAVEASKVMEADVTGVDLITNKHTGVTYILEVNRGPQLVSSSDDVEALNDTVRAYRDFILEKVVEVRPKVTFWKTPIAPPETKVVVAEAPGPTFDLSLPGLNVLDTQEARLTTLDLTWSEPVKTP